MRFNAIERRVRIVDDNTRVGTWSTRVYVPRTSKTARRVAQLPSVVFVRRAVISFVCRGTDLYILIYWRARARQLARGAAYIVKILITRARAPRKHTEFSYTRGGGVGTVQEPPRVEGLGGPGVEIRRHGRLLCTVVAAAAAYRFCARKTKPWWTRVISRSSSSSCTHTYSVQLHEYIGWTIIIRTHTYTYIIYILFYYIRYARTPLPCASLPFGSFNYLFSRGKL